MNDSNPPSSHQTLRGGRGSPLGPIGSMIAATGLWAVSLIAPVILSAYSPLQITAGRYLFYGLASAAILFMRFRHRPLKVRHWLRAGFYGLAGNLAVSVLVSFAIQSTGAAVVIPIVGTLPICISVAGSRHLPLSTRRRLCIPFVLVSGGLMLVLMVQMNALGVDAKPTLSGVAAAFATVFIWTWYALSNSRFLRANPEVKSSHWSCAIGVATLVVCVAFALASVGAGRGPVLFDATPGQQGWPAFMLVTMTLGVGTSWLATSLFNHASLALPMGLVGQLLVLETVFGVLYVCVYGQTVPPPLQAIGMLVTIAGIWLSARELIGGGKPDTGLPC